MQNRRLKSWFPVDILLNFLSPFCVFLLWCKKNVFLKKSLKMWLPFFHISGYISCLVQVDVIYSKQHSDICYCQAENMQFCPQGRYFSLYSKAQEIRCRTMLTFPALSRKWRLDKISLVRHQGISLQAVFWMWCTKGEVVLKWCCLKRHFREEDNKGLFSTWL